MQAPAAESALPRRGPILLQFWAENFDSAVSNARSHKHAHKRTRSGQGRCWQRPGSRKQLRSKARENALPHRRREFCGLVTRNDENRTTRTFDYALRGASQKQPP